MTKPPIPKGLVEGYLGDGRCGKDSTGVVSGDVRRDSVDAGQAVVMVEGV